MNIKFLLYTLTILATLILPISQAHSQALTSESVDMLLKPYLQMQNTLSKDDLDNTKSNAKVFIAKLKVILNSKTHTKEEQDLFIVLNKLALNISSTKNLKEARTFFLSLSNNMITIVETIGPTHNLALFKAHCPMAFENKGASWLQKTKTVTNPYYGSSMLQCGSIEKLK